MFDRVMQNENLEKKIPVRVIFGMAWGVLPFLLFSPHKHLEREFRSRFGPELAEVCFRGTKSSA